MAKTIRELVTAYFEAHPNEELSHDPVVDWVTEQYLEEHPKPPRDPWRMIRQLYQEGQLIKVKTGVYKYDPDHVHEVELFEFSAEAKKAVLARDSYRCVICGLGREHGVAIVADHIKPRSKGGPNTLENGQTLCSQHNLLKKNYSQTEAGKRYFIKMYEIADTNQDEKMIAFCRAVFDAYDEYEVDFHIARPDRD